MKLKDMTSSDTRNNSGKAFSKPQIFYLEYVPSFVRNRRITDSLSELRSTADSNVGDIIDSNNVNEEELTKLDIQGNQENKELQKCSCPKTFYLDRHQFFYLLTQLYYNSRMKLSTSREDSYVVKIIVREPMEYSIDYRSNDMANMSMVEKRELEHSMNWLSTLGGAFSALGEKSVPFAQRAGRVSKGQFLIAMKLGSPQTMSRCWLYAAISLLQTGKLKLARDILKREYAYAVSLPDDSDPRLRRMCIGIWAKLQYEWKLKRARKRPLEHKRANGSIKSET